MDVVINGQKRSLRDGMTLRDLVIELELEGKPIAVEVNREVVPKTRFAATALRDGDRLEVVSLVGGG
ncbi:MAG: sulfur carrier protein ThiS [Planctomycetes bacterium]|nr:sulfur carrier protein ThiS [Planctomycetota bacterium]